MTNEQQSADEVELASVAGSPAPTDQRKSAPADRETAGPYDISEVPSMRPYVDFGSIKIAPREGLQLRLEVDERQKRVVAVTLDYEGSLLQLQAFSAPKSTGLWHQVREEILNQFSSQGAVATEETGPFGPELLVVTKVPAEQGGGTRAVRFIAVDGPRWMLRGVISGAGAEDSAVRERVLAVFRDTVVVRGDQPMPPRDLLPLHVPAGVAQGQNPGAAAE